MTRQTLHQRTILLRDDDEITKMERGNNGHLYRLTKSDMKHLSISETRLVPEQNKLKETLKKQTKRKAFECLINIAKNNSKVKALSYV